MSIKNALEEYKELKTNQGNKMLIKIHKNTTFSIKH